MKNKNTVYLLGVLVLLIWGMIIYRVVSAFNQENPPATFGTYLPPSKEPYNDYTLKKDTGKLLLNYRDPFSPLADRDTAIRTVVKPPPAGPGHLQTAPPLFNWGFIKYSGYIRNPSSKKLIAMLTINGKNAMLAEGESAADVTLLKNLKDSVMVRYKKQNKFIVMNTPSL